MSIITISRGSYSRGKEIAEEVTQRMGYQCIARETIIEASEQFNIPEIKLVRAIHDAPSILDRFVHGRDKYIAYFHSGLFQKRYQAKTVRILTVTTNDRRVQTLKTITEDVGGKRRFWFTTFDQVTPQAVLTGQVWQVASMVDPQQLV